MRKLMLSCLGCLALALLVLAPSASAESETESFDFCQLRTTANFTPGLTTSSQAFTYNLRGEIEGCRSSESKGQPDQSGKITAGQTKNEEVVNSVTGATDVVTYQEPVPTGSGDCAGATTTGMALTQWAQEGVYTVWSYSTTGGLPQALTGTVAESMTLTAVNAKAGDPTTFTIKTNRFAGDAVHGYITVQPAEPTACNTSTGVTTAPVLGEVAIAG